MTLLKTSAILAAVLTQSGCGLFTTTSPVLNVNDFDSNKIAYYTAEGGVVIKGPKGGVCVMPPAQASRQLETEAKSSVSVQTPSPVNVAIDGSGSLTQSTAKLYDQSQGNLYLQFAMYRVCEFAANKEVSSVEYKELLQKVFEFGKQLVELEIAKLATARQEAATEEKKAQAEIERAKDSAEVRVPQLQQQAPQPAAPR